MPEVLKSGQDVVSPASDSRHTATAAAGAFCEVNVESTLNESSLHSSNKITAHGTSGRLCAWLLPWSFVLEGTSKLIGYGLTVPFLSLGICLITFFRCRTAGLVDCCVSVVVVLTYAKSVTVLFHLPGGTCLSCPVLSCPWCGALSTFVLCRRFGAWGCSLSTRPTLLLPASPKMIH